MHNETCLEPAILIPTMGFCLFLKQMKYYDSLEPSPFYKAAMGNLSGILSLCLYLNLWLIFFKTFYFNRINSRDSRQNSHTNQIQGENVLLYI